MFVQTQSTDLLVLSYLGRVNSSCSNSGHPLCYSC